MQTRILCGVQMPFFQCRSGIKWMRHQCFSRVQGAVLLIVGWSYVGNDVTHSTLLDRACACSYENLPRYRSYRVSNTAPWSLTKITLMWFCIFITITISQNNCSSWLFCFSSFARVRLFSYQLCRCINWPSTQRFLCYLGHSFQPPLCRLKLMTWNPSVGFSHWCLVIGQWQLIVRGNKPTPRLSLHNISVGTIINYNRWLIETSFNQSSIVHC